MNLQKFYRKGSQEALAAVLHVTSEGISLCMVVLDNRDQHETPCNTLIKSNT